MPNTQHPTPDHPPGGAPQYPNTLSLLLEGVAVIWLVVVAAQYALVLLIPGAPDMSASYLALLAGVLVAGIMYRLSRSRGREGE